MKQCFIEVLLSEPPFGPEVGPSLFDPDVAYMLRATWPVPEQQRFAGLKSFQGTSESLLEALRLTPTEKTWPKNQAPAELRAKHLRRRG